MKQKARYTLKELFDGLPIPLTELSKLSGKSHGTLTRIRDGEPARRSTINKLLIVLSEVYKLDLSTDNVDGIVLEGRQQERPEKAEKPPVSPSEVQTTTPVSEGRQKRTYKGRDTTLPDGCILASKFAENHAVKRPTFYAHMTEGLGPGLIGMSTDTISERDRVKYSERPKPNRPGENEKYLDQQQQRAAIEFWKRHSVDYSECDQSGCYCHTLKQENN